MLLFLSHLRALPSLQELTSFVDSRRVGIRVACDIQGDHPAVISAALQHHRALPPRTAQIISPRRIHPHHPGHLVAVCDNLGRVLVVDVSHGVICRVIKGCRDA